MEDISSTDLLKVNHHCAVEITEEMHKSKSLE
jgi:hypothetical protein